MVKKSSKGQTQRGTSRKGKVVVLASAKAVPTGLHQKKRKSTTAAVATGQTTNLQEEEEIDLIVGGDFALISGW